MAKRRGSKLANLVNSMAFFPYLMPSLAFGAIYLSMSSKLPWLRGFLLLALVGSVKYIPFASRSGLNAMLQLSGEIEEAAVIVGIMDQIYPGYYTADKLRNQQVWTASDGTLIYLYYYAENAYAILYVCAGGGQTVYVTTGL